MTASTQSPTAEWSAWSHAMYHQLAENLGGNVGLCHLEQVVLRSKKEQRCANCGDVGTVKQAPGLIQSVSHYWLCDGCAEHYSKL